MIFHLDDGPALLGVVLALIISIFAHDGAQALAARALGDPKAWRTGAVSPRIERHLSPFSVVAMVIAGVGWTNPVEMNDVWRKRRFRVAASILAGPVAMAALGTGALAGAGAIQPKVAVDIGNRTIELATTPDFPTRLLLWMAITFLSLTILYLLPVPPMDGGRILFTLGPTSPGWVRWRYKLQEENIGIVIVLVVLLLPVLFPSVPSVVNELASSLYQGLSDLVA